MSREHAVTVYLSEPLWQTLQAQARQDWRETVADVIVTTLAQALTTSPKPVQKLRPGRQRSTPEFGLLLRHAREQHGWRYATLGRYAQVHATHIGRLERGERAPTAYTVGCLARALQLGPDETAALYRAAGFVWEANACAS